MSRNIWSTLGIARTDDVVAIRRAYARRLKEIDVDADPEAFITVRHAFDAALASATARPEEPDPAWEEEEEEGERGLLADEDGEQDAAWEGDHSVPADGEDPNARFAALVALLFQNAGDDETYAVPDEAALVAAVRAILDHPEMDSIDHSARVEAWLAQLLFESAPRSDPVIALVVDRFEWEKREGAWDQPVVLEELLSRRRAFRLIDEVTVPGHPLHKAWRDLTSDAGSLGLSSIAHRSQVERLLGTIRQSCPAAESALDPYRVALWDERLNRTVEGRLKWVGIGFFALFVVSRILVGGQSGLEAAPTEYRTVFSDPVADLAPYVEEASLGQFDVEALAHLNPRLHAQLIERWQRASARGGRDGLFPGDVRELLEEAAWEGLRGGSPELQADYWRLHADRLAWIRSRDVESCDRAISGSTIRLVVPADFHDRLRDLKARALADEVEPGQRSSNVSFPIPGPIFAEARRRSGLDRDTLDAALNRRGTPAERCAAHIALLEAALAAPPAQRDPLLRDLSRVL